MPGFGIVSAPVVYGQVATRPVVAANEDRRFTVEEQTNIAVYEAVNRGVVNINTKATVATGLFLMEVPSEGAGSGIVLDREGHVLTNFHVGDGAREIQAVLYDGSAHAARVIGIDPATDVAVIKVEAPEAILHPVTFGMSNDLRVGQRGHHHLERAQLYQCGVRGGRRRGPGEVRILRRGLRRVHDRVLFRRRQRDGLRPLARAERRAERRAGGRGHDGLR